MLSLLAGPLIVKALVTDGLPAFTSPAQVVDTLARMGYALFLPENGQSYGKLKHDGVTANAALNWTEGNRRKGVPNNYLSLSIYIELATPGAKPDGEPWVPSRSSIGNTPVAFVTHLGGSATESAQVDFRQGATVDGTRKALDEFWAKGRAFAKAHRAPFEAVPEFDPAKAKLDQGLALDRADATSFQRAALSWGWTLPKWSPYSAPGWIFPVKVGERKVFLQQEIDGPTGIPRRISLVRFDAKPIDPPMWMRSGRSRVHVPVAIEEDDGRHVPMASEPIELAKGVTLGELRRRIEVFAAKG